MGRTDGQIERHNYIYRVVLQLKIKSLIHLNLFLYIWTKSDQFIPEAMISINTLMGTFHWNFINTGIFQNIFSVLTQLVARDEEAWRVIEQ